MSYEAEGPWLYDTVSEVHFGPRCKDQEEAEHLCFKAVQMFEDPRSATHDQLVEALHQLRKEQLGVTNYRKPAEEALIKHRVTAEKIRDIVLEGLYKNYTKREEALKFVLDNIGELQIIAEELEAS